MNHNRTINFFNIPLVLQQEVLGSWLTIKDVAKMDSAICAKETRPMFLELLSKRDMVLNNSTIYKEVYGSSMAWIVARKVSVTVCHLYNTVDPSLYIPFYSCTGKRIETLTITSKEEDVTTFTQMMSSVAFYCTNIKEISLKSCTSVRGLEILLYTPQASLINIFIDSCNLTEFVVEDLVLPSLQRLSITYSINITSNTFKQLLQAVPNLEILVAFQFIGWPSDVRFPNYLRKIYLKFSDITDAMLSSLVHSCPLLEVVDLGDCELLTDVSVIELVQHAKHISALSLSCSRNFSDAALEAIAMHCGERLKHLCLYGCESVTDAGIYRISEACHSLLGLGIGGRYMDHITTPAIQALLQSNPFLQEVSLGCADDQEDVHVMFQTLAESCPCLHYLDINELMGCTESDILLISRSCTQLRTVVVDPDCTVVNPLSLHLWQEHCSPRIEFSSENDWLPFWHIEF